MSREGTGSVVVAFDDVDRLSSSVRAHTEFVRSRIGEVARAATDIDFVASLPLSPWTGVEAEGAIAIAVSRLVAYATVMEGIALISATVVSTYQLAEESLAIAAGELGATAGVVGEAVSTGSNITIAGFVTSGSIAVLLGAAAALLKVAVDSVVSGFADEFVDSLVPGLRKTLDDYGEHPSLLIGGGALFAAHFGSNIGKAFSMGDVFARAITRAESTLGRTGPFYDDILRALIASGNALGFFIDREAELVPPPRDEEELATYARDRASISWARVFGTSGAFSMDEKGRIVPSDVVSLFASGRQIDDVGKDEFATIRIITCSDNDGRVVGYTVQIPSTQSAYPWRSAAPNDVTADLHAMITGEQTALSRAVLEAMEASGIAEDPDGPPILMTGFSLGGIIAASIAASDSRHNIRQVITAGSPIARIAIPDRVDVLAWEANGDPVCASEGMPNPKEWTTIRRDAPLLATESAQKVILPNEAHDLERYARMASAEDQLGADPKIARFFDGTVTIHDYYAIDRRQD